MQLAGGLAQPFQGLGVSRFVAATFLVPKSLTFSKDKTRTTLTMDDLSAALGEYGINARKPEFYI